MWYGYKKNPNIQKMLKNKSYRLNLKDRKFGSPLPRSNTYPRSSFNFQIPMNWQLILLQKSVISSNASVYYAYSGTYFINFSLFGNPVPYQYDTQTNTISFHIIGTPYNYYAYLKSLGDIFTRLIRPFFLKIRFKGKGYYMYKNSRNTIAPQMGYAHRVYVYSSATSVKFLSKTKILLFGLSKRDVMSTGYGLLAVKPVNIFTGRGVRFARQVIYKKTGKVGAYR